MVVLNMNYPFVLLFLLYGQVLATGVCLHTTLISRIHRFLPKDIQNSEFYPYLLAGAYFPDAFYSCGENLADASEYLHWPPFLALAVDYCNKNITITSQKLKFKAFLYGVFSHQVMDSSWHSIRLNQGLLFALANLDFGGNIDDAHKFLDTAGDFMHLTKIQDVSYYKTSFELPSTDHILNIMAQAGFELSLNTLQSCVSLGSTALRSELLVKDAVGPIHSKKSPWLDDSLESYYLGGVQEITNSLIKCLPNLNEWFDGNPPDNPWEICGSLISGQRGFRNENDMKVTQKNGYLTLSPWIAHGHFGHSIATGNFLEEHSIAVGANYEEMDGSVYILPLSEFTKPSVPRVAVAQKVKGLMNRFKFPHRFGSKVVSYPLMGEDYLIVNEPGTSSLHFYAGHEKVLTIVDISSSSSYGSKGNKEAYTSIVVGDVDHLGLPNIFLGSPYSDVDGRAQRGKVTVLKGSRLGFLLLHQVWPKVIDIEQVTDFEIHLPKRYTLDAGYEHFGAALSFDHRHIYASSEGHGTVFVFSHDGVFSHVIFKEKVDRIKPSRRTSRESARFGSKLMLSGTFKGIDFLLVGAHAEINERFFSSVDGGIYVYIISETSIKFTTKLFVKTTSKKVSKFGWTAIVREERLYISAPAYKRHGAIFVISLDKILSTRRKMIEVNEIVLESEGESYTGFGESLAVVEDKLIIGEPQYGFSEMLEENKVLIGRALIYDL